MKGFMLTNPRKREKETAKKWGHCQFNFIEHEKYSNEEKNIEYVTKTIRRVKTSTLSSLHIALFCTG